MHATTVNVGKVHVARRVHVSSYIVIATTFAKAHLKKYDLAIAHLSSYVFFLCQYLLMLLTCKGTMICSLPSFNLVAKVLRDPTWAMPFCVHLRSNVIINLGRVFCSYNGEVLGVKSKTIKTKVRPNFFIVDSEVL
jgi:hypothetical protein